MKHVLIGAALLGLLSPAPLQAQQLAFAPETFAILGGMPDEQPVVMRPSQKGMGFVDEKKNDAVPERQVVAFERNLPPGSILVRTQARELYFVLPGDRAILYPVGVGREGFTWSGSNQISRKTEWPDWRPPQQMIERELRKGKIIPEFMAGGPHNPLGARALYIGSTQFRIHGTTQPWSIGRAASSGCIRMLNEHVIDLFDRVQVGALVVVE